MANAAKDSDLEIKRLLRVREQLDDAIDSINTIGIKSNGLRHENASGILLPRPKNDSDYVLIVYGRVNFLVCQQALAHRRNKPPD